MVNEFVRYARVRRDMLRYTAGSGGEATEPEPAGHEDHEDHECPNCGEAVTSAADLHDLNGRDGGQDMPTCSDCGIAFHSETGGINGSEEPICPRCTENYFTCDNCNNTFHNDDYGEGGLCQNCHEEEEEEEQESDLIHPYGYKPDPVFHGEGRHYGAELEAVLKEGSLHDAAEKTLDRLNEGLDDEDFAYLKEDGSLSGGVGGFEIVTHPATLNVQKERWGNFLGGNVPKGVVSHDTDCCGLHVHVERDGMSDLQIGKILSFVNSAANKPFVEAIARRKSDRWAKLDPSKRVSDAKKRNASRYEAVNLQNKNTIEFRIFKGTLNKDSFQRSLEFVDAVVEFCRPAEHSITDTHGTDAFFRFVTKHRKTYPLLHNFIKKFDSEQSNSVKLSRRSIGVPETGVALCASSFASRLASVYRMGLSRPAGGPTRTAAGSPSATGGG